MARWMPVEYLAIKLEVPSHEIRRALQACKMDIDIEDKFDFDVYEKSEAKVEKALAAIMAGE